MLTLIKQFIVSILLLSLNQFCYADPLTTQLSREEVALGETFFVTFMANTNIHTSPDFSPLQQDFRILNTNYGNEVDMINGVTSVQTYWRLQLEPKHAGELLIPEITFGNEKSIARKLNVTTAPVSQNQTSNVNNQTILFIRSQVDPATPYVQSQGLYTLKIYFSKPLREPRIELPQTKEVSFLELSDRPAYQITIQGKTYDVIEKTFAIFAKTAGAITIPPMRFTAFTTDDDYNFLNSPFGFYQPKQVSAVSDQITLNVRDIPSNYQGTTWLPADNIALTEQWSDKSRNWQAGQPVTRTIIMEAQGLQGEQLPDLNIEKIADVNVYVDRARRASITQHNKIIGVLEQKITYIPNASQSITVPPIKVNWWNTQTHANVVTQLNEQLIKIKGGVVSAPHANLITSSKSTVDRVKPFYTFVWFWIALALLLMWLMTLFLWLGKKIKIKTPPIPENYTKNLLNACKQNNAHDAQKYLLAWAKQQWPQHTFNLTTLSQFMEDAHLQLAIQELEQALYTKEPTQWDGHGLLKAFKRRKKKLDKNVATNLINDPLPPLNPKL